MVNNSNIVNAMVKYHFSDGIHTLPCKVNKQTHEVFDISGKTQLVKELVEDDDFSFDSDEEATEPCDGFTGCWELKDEDTNTVYRVHVMTKSNLN